MKLNLDALGMSIFVGLDITSNHGQIYFHSEMNAPLKICISNSCVHLPYTYFSSNRSKEFVKWPFNHSGKEHTKYYAENQVASGQIPHKLEKKIIHIYIYILHHENHYALKYVAQMVVESPSLETVKTQFDRTLEKLIQGCQQEI